MERIILNSYGGFKNIMANVIAYVSKATMKRKCEHNKNNDYEDYFDDDSNCEDIDCQSDCSLCHSENRSISLQSSKHSNRSQIL